MEIEPMAVLSILSVCFGIVGTAYGLRRNVKADDKREAAQKVSTDIKVDHVIAMVNELKNDVRENRDRSIITQQIVKDTWMQNNTKKGGDLRD